MSQWQKDESPGAASAMPSDPAARAIARMKPGTEGRPIDRLRSGLDKVNASDTDALQQMIQRIEAKLEAVVASLNAATIDAVCNENGTITVTLTLPDFPGT